MNLLQKNKLLYSRAGFGISITEFQNPKPINEAVDSLFPKSLPGDLELITAEDWAKHKPSAMKEIMDEGEKKEIKKAFRQKTKDINLLWVQAMVNTSYPLMEKTAMFWHGHFATHIGNPYYDQKLLNIFRKNGLGKFSDLLRATSKSSAMLQFLNNQQNKKQHPNENFAREVMELFTLGRGHYSEDDIKEAARAFTGWAFDGDGEFIFRKGQHDDGEKTFLGKTGKFTGDDIIDILLEQKQTSIFITQKIYRFFVSDEKMDDKRVNQLAKDFYDSNYHIGTLLKNIFTSDWFYSETICGSKIKSPIELLVGYQRLLPIQFNNDRTVIHLQKILGQYLFNPPSVAGWHGGKEWIDSSSLAFRMRLPEAIFLSKELNIKPKEMDFDIMEPIHGDMMQETQFKVGKITVDWNEYIAFWKKYKKEELQYQITNLLLPYPLEDTIQKELSNYVDNDTIDEYIKSITILLMELPEYQLT